MTDRESIICYVKDVLNMLKKNTEIPLRDCLKQLFDISKLEEVTKNIEDEKDLIDRWYLRKKLDGYHRLKEKRTVRKLYCKQASSFGSFADVTLTAEPAEHFQYECKAVWPDEYGVFFEEAIIDAIIETVFPPRFYRIMGAKFIVEDVRVHDIDSTEFSFYLATKMALNELLEDNY